MAAERRQNEKETAPVTAPGQLPGTPADHVVGAACNSLPAGLFELLIEVRQELGNRSIRLYARFGMPGSASTASTAASHRHTCRRTQCGHPLRTFGPAVPLHLGEMADDLPVQPKAKISRSAFWSRNGQHQDRTLVAAAIGSPDSDPFGYKSTAHSTEALKRLPASLCKVLLISGDHFLRVAGQVGHDLEQSGPAAT